RPGMRRLLVAGGDTATMPAKLSGSRAPLNGLIMFSLPWSWLYWKRASRLKKFQAQLPEALELVARALRSGQSLAAAMHGVAEEMPDPIAGEVGRVFDEQHLRIPIGEALKNTSPHLPHTHIL